jgi:hypothetical protein
VAAEVELVRREWSDAHAALEAEARDPRRYASLLEQVDAVLAALRKRMGQTFTLRELADAYADADRWARDAVADNAPASGWPRTLSVVVGAAFHVYQRGAVDFRP